MLIDIMALENLNRATKYNIMHMRDNAMNFFTLSIPNYTGRHIFNKFKSRD